MISEVVIDELYEYAPDHPLRGTWGDDRNVIMVVNVEWTGFGKMISYMRPDGIVDHFYGSDKAFQREFKKI